MRSFTYQVMGISRMPSVAVNHQLPSGLSIWSGTSSVVADLVMPSIITSNWPGSRLAAKAPEIPA